MLYQWGWAWIIQQKEDKSDDNNNDNNGRDNDTLENGDGTVENIVESILYLVLEDAVSLGQNRESISNFNMQQGENSGVLVTISGKVRYEKEPIRNKDGQLAKKDATQLVHYFSTWNKKVGSALHGLDVIV